MEEASKRNAAILAFLSTHLPSRHQALDSSADISDNDSVINWPDTDETGSSCAESPVLDHGFSFESLLLAAADLGIKVLLFQISLLMSAFTFPIWFLHRSLLLILNPFGTLRNVRDGVMEKLLWISKGLLERISTNLYRKLKSKQKLATRMAWGIFWSFYVLIVLLGLLVMAFIAGSMIMRKVVEEPVMVKKNLSFDYTKSSPDAFVELGKQDGVPFGLDDGGKVDIGKYGVWRFVPPSHKLKLTVSLTLPESDYNWKLGVFQVKTEFSSREGQVVDSSSYPCMLRFKSSPIRYLGPFIESGYLLAGYSLESQTLSLEMTGFTEGTEPTAFIWFTLEQRAEHKAAAGIPEIYTASMKLESELPIFKRVIWDWRWTVFIWVSTGFFLLELSVILICCRPILIPNARTKHIYYKEISLQGKTS